MKVVAQSVKVLRGQSHTSTDQFLSSPSSPEMAVLLVMIATLLATASCRPRPYDPDDPYLDTVLPSKDVAFEAFYPREAYGVDNGSARPSHGHASFYQHRNPALVDAKNSPAYGFRFDGGRRFNFDDDEER